MNAEAIDRFGAAFAAADEALDWSSLEPVYCEGDARGFFDEGRRAELRDTGLAIATELAEALGTLPERKPGRSLYVGAAVAELPIILFDALVLGRKVRWINLPGTEASALDHALASAEETAGVKLPRVETGRWRAEEIGPCDHLWLVSVLTDPERFPALHDELYDRVGSPEAVGGGHPARERDEARRLIERALDCLAPRAVVSTTDEELPILRRAAEHRGGRLDRPNEGRTTALVGDVLRHARWRADGAPS